MTNTEAAAKPELCQKQIIRLKKKYRIQGEAGLIHGNRGRSHRHRIGDEVRTLVLKAYREVYYDFNFFYFTEYFNEKAEIRVSRSTFVRIPHDEGIRSKKGARRQTKLHRSRPRKVAAGILWRLTLRLSAVWQGVRACNAARLY